MADAGNTLRAAATPLHAAPAERTPGYILWFDEIGMRRRGAGRRLERLPRRARPQSRYLGYQGAAGLGTHPACLNQLA